MGMAAFFSTAGKRGNASASSTREKSTAARATPTLTRTRTTPTPFVLLLLLAFFQATVGSKAVSGDSETCNGEGEGECEYKPGDAKQPPPSLEPIAARDFGSEELCANTAEAVDGEEDAKDTVLVRLNGENNGILMKWKPGCGLSLARSAARKLRTSRDGAEKFPLYLYDRMGYPIQNGDETAQRGRVERAGSTVHVLLDGETWVWPGEEVGHSWSSEGIDYLTLSLSPKVILASNIIDPETCDKMIELGEQNLSPSPERHYSDDPKYKNYRTSNTAQLGGKLEKKARRRGERAARLPSGYSESLQLVRYNPGEWYKEHYDFYHNWEWPDTTSTAERFVTWAKHVLKYTTETQPLPFSFQAAMKKTEYHLDIPENENGKLFDLQAFDGACGWYLLEMDRAESVIGPDWMKWMLENLESKSRSLTKALFDKHPRAEHIFSVLIEAWNASGGCPGGLEAARARRIQPNRHVTVFYYLNDDFEGGETVFPKAIPPEGAKQIIAASGTIEAVTEPRVREGMNECGKGLSVTPKKGAAAIFYARTGSGNLDYMSLHGGCPPVSGVKYAMNGFMWNKNAKEGWRDWRHVFQ
mmetsp:Transcript_30166/g.53067  ORF Transcript_30166/g.53067 Transcript_30166/m.53067 type:complete len:585 (+) Transcript_30166:88-1842(+)